MQSRLQDTMKPAITALLTAIDETMNSNTMLLKVQAEKPLTTSNYQDELRKFLHSPLFIEMVLEIDQQREFYTYNLWDRGTDDQLVMHAPPGNLVKDQIKLVFTQMNEHQFAERLHWMLREALSPYHMHRTKQQTQEFIQGFFWEVFAPESWPLESPLASLYWKTHPWSFYAVKPDFLYDTGYYDNVEIDDIPPFAYFDGGSSDSCTFFYEADIFYLFFTNGSP